MVLLPPINALFLMRTPTQSTVQEENRDQLVSWQSSWQGSWHGCVTLGLALANARQSLTSAWVPFRWTQDRAAGQDKRLSGHSLWTVDVESRRQWNIWTFWGIPVFNAVLGDDG